jgi:hypothetical protein
MSCSKSEGLIQPKRLAHDLGLAAEQRRQSGGVSKRREFVFQNRGTGHTASRVNRWAKQIEEQGRAGLLIVTQSDSVECL